MKEMDRYKWLKSQEVNYDIGKKAYMEWVQKYGAIWRMLDDYVKETKEDRKAIEKDLDQRMTNFREEDRYKWLKRHLTMWLRRRKAKILKFQSEQMIKLKESTK